MNCTKIAALLCAAQAVPSVAGQSQDRPHCASRDRVIEQLADRYGETRRSVGLGSDNTMVEVFASDRTGSWTITVTTPEGLTCLVASGQAYQARTDSSRPQGHDT